tara:strand:+ start:701 stop:1822 length:1122 start_codon:yes stop_codon:yes gene_type:complete
MTNSKVLADLKKNIIDLDKAILDLSEEDFEKLLLLRNSGLLDDNASKLDFIFLAQMTDKLPRQVIAEATGMSVNKVWHYQKKHVLKSIDAPESITSHVANETFRFLIEKHLKLPVDKTLPKKITRDILNGAYYSIYTHALAIINEQGLGRRMSALSYLACSAYPNKFRHFQFRMGNDTERFNDLEDLNLALVWSFEQMTGIDLLDNGYDENSIRMLISEPKVGFDADELRKFYIPRKAWSRFYPNFNSLKDGLISFVGVPEAPEKYRYSTSRLREILISSGRNIAKCEICNQTENLHIHHIYPVAGAQDFFTPEYINSPDNLLVLCRNHHGFAGGFDWQSTYTSGNNNQKDELINFLRSTDTRIAANDKAPLD